MARPAKGQVVERRGKNGARYALRFRAYGDRHYITTDATSRAEAEKELGHTLADVERGIWKPPSAVTVAAALKQDPQFWTFAKEWFERREADGLDEDTIADFEWSLKHLAWFGHHRLSEITAAEIDRYTAEKTRERQALEKQRAKGEKVPRALSNSSINHTLRHLAQILDVAVDRELIASNPAANKRRRFKAERPKRPWVEPQQLPVFLAAPKSKVGKVTLALLCGTGLRIDEALELRWRDVDLGTGHVYVVKAKTPKGERRIPLAPALREQLTLWKTDTAPSSPDGFVIHTATGRRHNPSNLRRDVLDPAVRAADLELAKLGIRPIGHVTFHGLRRTFASLRSYMDKPIRQTADLLGHEDVRFTLNVYAQSSLDPDEMLPPVRRQFDAALEWAQIGTSADQAFASFDTEATKNPV
jgi:integrase